MTEPLQYTNLREGESNKVAVWAMVLGITGLLFSAAGFTGVMGDLGLIVGLGLDLAALTVGIVAMMRPGQKGLALTGIVTGSLPVALVAFLMFAPPLTGRVAAARRAATLVKLANMKSAMLTFEKDNARFPTTTEGLDALVSCPPSLVSTWHAEMDSVPSDPWGTPFKYLGPDTAADGKFHIISAGPDGVFGTSDDLSSD